MKLTMISLLALLASPAFAVTVPFVCDAQLSLENGKTLRYIVSGVGDFTEDYSLTVDESTMRIDVLQLAPGPFKILLNGGTLEERDRYAGHVVFQAPASVLGLQVILSTYDASVQIRHRLSSTQPPFVSFGECFAAD